MTAVVVLNATYEPIARTSVARAINLVLAGTAVIDESDPLRQIRHQRGSFPWPKLIRLLRFIKIPFRYGEMAWSKSGVLRRDGRVCAYCGKTATTVDHIVPTSKGGGARDWLNTVAACVKCNGKKADRTPAQANMTLNFKPYAPSRSQLIGA